MHTFLSASRRRCQQNRNHTSAIRRMCRARKSASRPSSSVKQEKLSDAISSSHANQRWRWSNKCETYLKSTEERARRWPLLNFSYDAFARISKIWTWGAVRERMIELRGMITHFLDPSAITNLGTLL